MKKKIVSLNGQPLTKSKVKDLVPLLSGQNQMPQIIDIYNCV